MAHRYTIVYETLPAQSTRCRRAMARKLLAARKKEELFKLYRNGRLLMQPELEGGVELVAMRLAHALESRA